MRRAWVAAMLIVATSAVAGEKAVTGSVTYLASGLVYTSLGREAGVADSSTVYIVSGRDTTGVLQVVALSSKSSSCRTLMTKREIRVGDPVLAKVSVPEQQTPRLPDQAPSTAASSTPAAGVSGSTMRTVTQESWVDVVGRVSTQVYATRYDNPDYNVTQPGVVLSMRGKARDAPLTFDFYGNVRTQAYGNTSPFSRSARNQTRIYRLSLEYNDGFSIASIGRIIPTVSPMVGAIDGLLLARRMGRVVVGTTFGFQPGFAQRGIDTEYRKGALFVSYEPGNGASGTLTASYARTYFRSTLDREVASVFMYLYMSGPWSVYGNSEVDLRKKSGNAFTLAPSLTTMYVTVNYRVNQSLTLGLGGDASRPLYTYQASRMIPDSLLVRKLRGGVSLHVNVYLPGGISLYNTYTPRSGRGSFAQEYSDYASLSFSDIASTGLSFRSNINFNENEFTRSTGYGAHLQHHFPDIVDVTLRYQRYQYTIKRQGERNASTTLGVDLLVPLTRMMSIMTSYDRLRGYGADSHSLFAELSVRF